MISLTVASSVFGIPQRERIRGLKADEQFEFDRRWHGKLSRLRTLENARAHH
jgi:hypothetical protein